MIKGDKIICNKCRWSWKIEDGGNDLFICHKCGNDNEPKQLKGNSPKSTIKGQLGFLNWFDNDCEFHTRNIGGDICYYAKNKGAKNWSFITEKEYKEGIKDRWYDKRR